MKAGSSQEKTDDQMVRGTNFTCFHAGPMERWTQFRLEPPDLPMLAVHEELTSASADDVNLLVLAVACDR